MREIIFAAAVVALSAPAIASDKVPAGTGIDMYGEINVAYRVVNRDLPFYTLDREPTQGIYDNSSMLGAHWRYDIASATTAFARVEISRKGQPENYSDLTVGVDKAYIGIDGRFGRIWMGRDDNLMERMIDRNFEYFQTRSDDWSSDWNYDDWVGDWGDNGDRLVYTSPTGESFGGGELQVSAALSRTYESKRQLIYPDDPEIAFQEVMVRSYKMGLEVGVTHSTDDYEVSVVASSNHSIYGADKSGSTFGVYASANLTDHWMVAANYIKNQGSIDRYYSVLTSYSWNQFDYTISYESAKQSDTREFSYYPWAMETQNISAQIRYAATENLYVYIEASDGDEITQAQNVVPSLTRGSKTAVGLSYAF